MKIQHLSKDQLESFCSLKVLDVLDVLGLLVLHLSVVALLKFLLVVHLFCGMLMIQICVPL